MDQRIHSVEYTQVNIRDIRPDMVLARDVVLKNGMLLIPKDTMLNAVNFTKLMEYRVQYVFIKKEKTEDKTPIIEENKPMDRIYIPVEKRKDFKKFSTTYEDNVETIKETLHDIGNGGTIDLPELYKLTDDLMGTLQYKSEVFNYIGVIKTADEHTYTHSNNVAMLCNVFGKWLGLDDESMVNLTAAGMLHDVGKTKIPPEILNKPGKLTEEEFKIMKSHTILGYRMLEPLNIPYEVKLSALMHHEKIDGTGYPLGIKDTYISKIAKIVSICDIYDAMTANRVYRKKICPFEVIRTFEFKCYGELDTENLLVFLKNIAYSYIGCMVKLSDGRDAEIVFINQRDLSRPIVKCGEEIIDLSARKELYIKNMAY